MKRMGMWIWSEAFAVDQLDWIIQEFAHVVHLCLWEAPTSEASPPVHMHHHNMQVFKLIWTCFETQFDWQLDKKRQTDNMECQWGESWCLKGNSVLNVGI